MIHENIVFLDLFGLIMPYLFGFFFIRMGIMGLKTGLTPFTGQKVDIGSCKGSIFFGALIGMGGSAFFAYRICAKVLGGHIGAIMASYLSFIAPALVISATAFYFYRYWKNYVLDKKKQESE